MRLKGSPPGGVPALSYVGAPSGTVVGSPLLPVGFIISHPVYVDPVELGSVDWAAVTGKPAVIGAGSTQAAARTAIDAASTGSVTSALSRANHTGTQASSTISDFTEAAQDAISTLLAGASGVTLSYNDAANTLTITGGGAGGLDAEAVRDAIGVAMVGTAPITVTVNDGADTITISTTATVNDTDANLKARLTIQAPSQRTR